MAEKGRYPIRRLVNWYFANHCTRKCFDDNSKLHDHYNKLMDFAEKSSDVTMTHKSFLNIFNDHTNICTLHDSFKRRSIGWKLFMLLQHTPEYDSNKIVVKNKLVQTMDGQLPKPRPPCQLCRMIGAE